MAVDFWHICMNKHPIKKRACSTLKFYFLCSDVFFFEKQKDVLKHAYLILPKMIWTVGFVSLFGNTFALAIASDFLTIATFHLWIIYRLFTFIFDCQLRFLSVLFNIFRGTSFLPEITIDTELSKLGMIIIMAHWCSLVTFVFLKKGENITYYANEMNRLLINSIS
jgi:hypothetical protein